MNECDYIIQTTANELHEADEQLCTHCKGVGSHMINGEVMLCDTCKGTGNK